MRMPRINKIKNWVYQFLRKTQKYTGTDNVYLAKGGFWLTLGQLISTAASFLLAVAFANLLDPVIYGNYRYILSVVGILGIFTLTGIGTAIIQATARGLEGSFYSGFKTKLKWSLLGSLVAIGGAIYYWLRGNFLLPIPLLISAIFLPLWQASGVYGSFLTGRKLFDIEVKYGSITQILSVFSLILTLFLTKNLFWLIAVYFVSNTFLNYFFYFLTQKKFNPNKKEDPETVSYGKHLSLMDILGQIAFYLDHVLVFHYLGAVELAIYHFAITPPEQIKGLLKNIQPLALPKFARRNGGEIKKTIFKKMAKLFFVLLPIIILYILTAPFLYKIFFPQYLESIIYSQIFSISLLATIAFLPLTALQSQMAKRELYKRNTAVSLIEILLLFVLVQFWGLFGVIIARIISRFVGLGINLFLVKKI